MSTVAPIWSLTCLSSMLLFKCGTPVFVGTADNGEDPIGGVWLHKQPSVMEGLDELSNSSDDDTSVRNSTEPAENEVTPIPDTPSSEQPETVPVDKPQVPVTTDGFMEDLTESEDDEDQDTFEDGGLDRPQSGPDPSWLSRAMSMCSEGEDIETLASEADSEKYKDELMFPEAFDPSMNQDEV